jgi:thiamine biosynthesis lipoprotein
MAALSGGAFDISVQPLWRLYEAHFWSHSDVQADIAARAREVAERLVDFRCIDSGAAAIGFTRPGMAITLNSLAQGHVTDAIADLLRQEGFESAVVDLGEFRTLGRHPDGRPWRLGIRNGKPTGDTGRTIELTDMALAVSGGYGTPFEPSGRFHHIFDPHTGASANAVVEVAVIGPRATTANALSTAICVAGEARAPMLLAAYPGTQAILTRSDGSVVTIAAEGEAAG